MEEKFDAKLETSSCFVALSSKPLNIGELIDMARSNDAGAVSSFIGTTRDTFESKRVLQLSYEAYDDMAIESMKTIATHINETWKVKKIVMVHKVGACPVGDPSIVIVVSSAHRVDSLAAVDYAINELKRSVPIWKKEIYEDGDSVWKANKEATALGGTVDETTSSSAT